MNEITNARRAAKEIREALKNNCLYVHAVDSRTGKEYRIVNAKAYNVKSPTGGQLLGQDIRAGIWFPISSWEQR